MLIKCSKINDFTEWNDYVQKTEEEINFNCANLENIKITNAIFQNKSGIPARFENTNLKNAELKDVDMSRCAFYTTNLTGIKAFGSTFQKTKFADKAILENSEFQFCQFDAVQFRGCNLKNINFHDCSFQDCHFFRSDLSSTAFLGGDPNPILSKVDDSRFNLCGAIFSQSRFNEETYFSFAKVSINTDFRVAHFNKALYSAGLKETLEYCNRRHNWDSWYKKQNKCLAELVKIFWGISDYGKSSKRVILISSLATLVFAIFYWLLPGVVSTSENHPDMTFSTGLYFSISTMTTLGFGDISANLSNPISKLLVIANVLTGYILLGALITVFSNLFTADGPSEGLVKHPSFPVKKRR